MVGQLHQHLRIANKPKRYGKMTMGKSKNRISIEQRPEIVSKRHGLVIGKVSYWQGHKEPC